ncbi:MAG TPA: DEAD/DEAH box helicase [Anaerolineae bacterium]|nr:DEAD/DEAH box helicase [Anaerolineae bacterium]
MSPTEGLSPLVLHLHWRAATGADDVPRFVFWAETASAAPPKRQRGRRAAHPKPRPHPFAQRDPGQIVQQLRRFEASLVTLGTETFVLMLPSTRTGPWPSPALPQSWEIDLKDPRLEPWIIEGTRVPFESVLGILRNLTSCDCPDHLILGSDIYFWQRVLMLALEILAHQDYVPTLVMRQGLVEARWRVVFEAPEVKDKVYKLAAAMPPVCRAEWHEEAPPPASIQLIQEFVAHTVDYFARTWGAAAPHHIGYLHNGEGVASWMKALVRPDAVIGPPDDRLRRLISQIEDWQRNLLPAGSTQYTIAFKLEPPPPAPRDEKIWHVPPGGWELRYYLRSRTDPNILVPAAQVWQTKEETLISQGLRFDYPQEKLLEGLGKAAKIFPPIEKSLHVAAPTGVTLTTNEVYQFLREAVPLLKQSGFSIILPSWWEQAGTRLGLKLHLHPTTPEPVDILQADQPDKPIAYHWELVLGDTTLTREAFAELVNLRSPLVQQNGRWLRLDPEQIEAAERFWQRHTFEGHLSLLHGIRVALAFDEHTRVSGLPVHSVQLGGWLPVLLKRLTVGDETLHGAPQPAGLQGELRPYQRYGAAWLEEHYHRGLGAILADDMGLGKSVQAIAFLLQEQAEQGGLPHPTLLICPTSLLGNWRREILRFGPSLKVYTHYGPDRARGQAFVDAVQHYDIVLTSYALARRDAEFLRQQHWFGVILDEAQTIKNPNAQITRVVNEFRADYRFALTGTPIENRLSELWSLFNFTNRGYLGSRAKFRKEFALPIENYQDPIALARLQRMVRPFILRRLKTDPNVIQDLPDRLEMDVYCTLTEEQVELYQKVVEEGLPRIADARGGERRIHVFNLLTKLKQILNHPVQYLYTIGPNQIPKEPLAGRSGKLDRLTAMLEELLEVGDKALIFTQFAEMGYLLADYLPAALDTPVLYLHGGVPGRKRQEMVNRFQEDPHAPPIFILTLKAGGLGLNLTAANHVFHYDRWWNPAVEKQAADRIFRIGQMRNVQIHKFITAGTLEENIQEMLERKRQLAESIIGTDESWLAQLSDEELVDLLTLHKDKIL